MPVRSLTSRVLKWPDEATVRAAVERWARAMYRANASVLRIGYFGSYARGNWGVGSDLDLIAIVDSSDLPFERRATTWDLSNLPVPADLLVYTVAEWDRLSQSSLFATTIEREARWLPCEPV